MNRPAKRMNRANMESATHFSKSYIEDICAMAEAITTDARKDERKQKCLCKACFYRNGRLGGSAITHQSCMSCGEDQVYGSTATDALCIDCAKKHNLCKQCGGDVELRERRRSWPEPTGNVTT